MKSKFDPNTPHDLHELQDDSVDDPVWTTDIQGPTPTDDEGGDLGGSAHEGLRTIGGLIDLLHGVEQDIYGWVERETDKGRDGQNEFLRQFLREPDKPVRTEEQAPKNWRATTYTNLNPTGTKILEEADRTRAVIVNWGPGIVYLTHDGNGQALQNSIQVPISTATFFAPRELRTQGVVYAIPATGTTPVIDVQEEGARR